MNDEEQQVRALVSDERLDDEELRVLPQELYEAVFDFEKRLREITKSADDGVEVESVYVTQDGVDVEFLLPGRDRPVEFSLERP